MGTEQAESKVYINILEIIPFSKVCDRLVFFFFPFMWFGFWRFQSVGNPKRLLTKAEAE